MPTCYDPRLAHANHTRARVAHMRPCLAQANPPTRTSLKTHPCLAHGKHTRPRACRSHAWQHAPMPGAWEAHPPTRMSMKCTHAWHTVSTPAHARVAGMHPCLDRQAHPPTRAWLKCTHAWRMVSTPAHARVAQTHTRPRACRSNSLLPGTWFLGSWLFLRGRWLLVVSSLLAVVGRFLFVVGPWLFLLCG